MPKQNILPETCVPVLFFLHPANRLRNIKKYAHESVQMFPKRNRNIEIQRNRWEDSSLIVPRGIFTNQNICFWPVLAFFFNQGCCSGSCTNCIGTNCIGNKLYRHKLYRHNLYRHNLYRTQIVSGTNCIGNKLYRVQTVSGTNCISSLSFFYPFIF
jgi:hypothetical protein